MKEFDVYSIGVCYASVCTTLSDDVATERLNAEYPTGIRTDWRISPDAFADGSANPHPCEKWPTTHRHILFQC